MRVAFDTTVLWAAFHKPAGPNFALLALAAQRTPMLDGFITDAVGAEFWWRATQQGVKGPGQSTPRTYTEDEMLPFLEAFEVLVEPANLAHAPVGRSLGQYAGLVGRPLGEVLHVITGKDRAALLAGRSTDRLHGRRLSRGPGRGARPRRRQRFAFRGQVGHRSPRRIKQICWLT